MLDVQADVLAPFLASDQTLTPGAFERRSLSDAARKIDVTGTDGVGFNAWIGNKNRAIRPQHRGHDLRLAIEGLGEFVVCPRRASAARIHGRAQAEDPDQLEIALGPLLSLLLAQRGVYCLHASAVSGPNGAVCFVGESGAGKSTLAAYLGAATTESRRLADDILPVRLNGGLQALPGYPQLKVPLHEQAGLTAGPVCVAAVIEVKATPAGEGTLRLEPLARAQSCLVLARHTVAARLFGRELLARHLEFCAAASGQLRCYALTYPHDRQNLPRALDLVRPQLGWR